MAYLKRNFTKEDIYRYEKESIQNNVQEIRHENKVKDIQIGSEVQLYAQIAYPVHRKY